MNNNNQKQDICNNCKRYPPMIDEIGVSRFIETFTHAWCEEFKEKNDDK